jgi:hypothetical protein
MIAPKKSQNSTPSHVAASPYTARPINVNPYEVISDPIKKKRESTKKEYLA